MEAIFFLIDIVGIVMLLYWSIMNDRQGADAQPTGLFAYRKSITPIRKPPGARGQRSGQQSGQRPGQRGRR